MQCEGIKWIGSISSKSSKILTCGCSDYIICPWSHSFNDFNNIPKTVSSIILKWSRSERGSDWIDTNVGIMHCHQQHSASSFRCCHWCWVAISCCLCKYCMLLSLWYSFGSLLWLLSWLWCLGKSFSFSIFNYSYLISFLLHWYYYHLWL